MRRCIRCDRAMIEDLVLSVTDGYAVDVREKGIFKGSLGKVKCAACPECGYTEIYLDRLDKIKKLEEQKS